MPVKLEHKAGNEIPISYLVFPNSNTPHVAKVLKGGEIVSATVISKKGQFIIVSGLKLVEKDAKERFKNVTFPNCFSEERQRQVEGVQV